MFQLMGKQEKSSAIKYCERMFTRKGQEQPKLLESATATKDVGACRIVPKDV